MKNKDLEDSGVHVGLYAGMCENKKAIDREMRFIPVQQRHSRESALEGRSLPSCILLQDG